MVFTSTKNASSRYKMGGLLSCEGVDVAANCAQEREFHGCQTRAFWLTILFAICLLITVICDLAVKSLESYVVALVILILIAISTALGMGLASPLGLAVASTTCFAEMVYSFVRAQSSAQTDSNHSVDTFDIVRIVVSLFGASIAAAAFGTNIQAILVLLFPPPIIAEECDGGVIFSDELGMEAVFTTNNRDSIDPPISTPSECNGDFSKPIPGIFVPTPLQLPEVLHAAPPLEQCDSAEADRRSETAATSQPRAREKRKKNTYIPNTNGNLTADRGDPSSKSQLSNTTVPFETKRNTNSSLEEKSEWLQDIHIADAVPSDTRFCEERLMPIPTLRLQAKRHSAVDNSSHAALESERSALSSVRTSAHRSYRGSLNNQIERCQERDCEPTMTQGYKGHDRQPTLEGHSPLHMSKQYNRGCASRRARASLNKQACSLFSGQPPVRTPRLSHFERRFPEHSQKERGRLSAREWNRKRSMDYEEKGKEKAYWRRVSCEQIPAKGASHTRLNSSTKHKHDSVRNNGGTAPLQTPHGRRNLLSGSTNQFNKVLYESSDSRQLRSVTASAERWKSSHDAALRNFRSTRLRKDQRGSGLMELHGCEENAGHQNVYADDGGPPLDCIPLHRSGCSDVSSDNQFTPFNPFNELSSRSPFGLAATKRRSKLRNSTNKMVKSAARRSPTGQTEPKSLRELALSGSQQLFYPELDV